MLGKREDLLARRLLPLPPPQLELCGRRDVGVERGPEGRPHLVAEVARVLAVARLGGNLIEKNSP